MNLKDKIVDFFLNKALGRILVRVSASVVSFLASGQIGLHLQVDPNEVNLLLNALAHSLISKLKPRAPEVPKPEQPAA